MGEIENAVAKKRKFRGTDRTYAVGEVESALAVWEWVLAHEHVPEAQRTQISMTIIALADDYGWSGLRSTSIQVSTFVDECWRWADAGGALYLTESSSFDWDFVPLVCGLLDWGKYADDNQYGNADWHPKVEDFMATVIAVKAMRLVA